MALGLALSWGTGAAGAAPTGASKSPTTTAKVTRSSRPATPTTVGAPRSSPPTTRATSTTSGARANRDAVSAPATSLIASDTADPAAGAGEADASATPGQTVGVSPGPPALLVEGPVDAVPETGRLLAPMTKLWLVGAGAAGVAIVVALLTVWYWRRTDPDAQTDAAESTTTSAGALASSATTAPSASRSTAGSLLAARHWASGAAGWDEWSSTDWDRDAAWRPYDDAFLTEPSESDPPTSENRVLVGAG